MERYYCTPQNYAYEGKGGAYAKDAYYYITNQELCRKNRSALMEYSCSLLREKQTGFPSIRTLQLAFDKDLQGEF